MNIPHNAIELGHEPRRYDIQEWGCTSCGATGNGSNVDCYSDATYAFQREDDYVQYCCAECMEENIWAITSH